MPSSEVRTQEVTDLDEPFGSGVDSLPEPASGGGLNAPPESPDLYAEDPFGTNDELEEPTIDLANVEVEPEAEPEPPPPPPRKPRAPRRKRVSTVYDASDQLLDADLAALLTSFTFGAGEHKVILIRVEPHNDPETGENIRGRIGTFGVSMTPEKIQATYGGGTYQIMVHGPRSAEEPKPVIKFNKHITFAGPPKPQLNLAAKDRKRRREEEKESNFIESMMERDDRRAERAENAATAAQKELSSSRNDVLRLVAGMNSSKGPDPMAAFAPMLERMAEDNKRRDEESTRRDQERRDDMKGAEQQRRDDATAAAEQRKLDRDERKVEEAERQRRHEKDMERARVDAKIRGESLEAQRSRDDDRSRQQVESNLQNMQMIMQMVMKSDSDSSKQSMNFMTMMSEASQKSNDTQMAMMREQSANKPDFMETVQQFTAIKELVSPSEPADDRPGWERALDKAAEMLPTAIGGYAAMNAGQALPQPPPPGGGPRRVGPGTIAVVDNIEDVQRRIAEQTAPHVKPPQGEVDPATKAGAIANQSMAGSATNDLSFFPSEYPPDAPEGLKLLVKALDLAMQNKLSFDDTYEKCIVPLHEVQKSFLKSITADVLIEYIEKKAEIPASWPVRGLDAEDKIRKLHAKLVAED